MKFRVHPDRAEAQLRPIALNAANGVLRTMEDFRRVYGNDLDTVMIVLAVAVISMAPYGQFGADTDYADQRQPIPDAALAPCNMASIAEATGLPRETARRKTLQLIRQGILRRTNTGSIALVFNAENRGPLYEAVRRQPHQAARLAMLLIEAGILEPQSRGRTACRAQPSATQGTHSGRPRIGGLFSGGMKT